MERPGGRLSQFHDVWKELGAPPKILQILKDSYKIQLLGEPVLTPPKSKWATHLRVEEMRIARDKVAQLSQKGMIEEVSWSTAEADPGLFSRLFCIKKRTGSGHRAIIDLSRFNDCVEKKSFKMTTIGDIRCTISRECFGTSVDLEDALKTSQGCYL